MFGQHYLLKFRVKSLQRVTQFPPGYHALQPATEAKTTINYEEISKKLKEEQSEKTVGRMTAEEIHIDKSFNSKINY